jgi:deoxyribose-phosphate aldolase
MIHNFKRWSKLNESKTNYNNKIDYTYLKDNATIDDIKQLCEDAIENNFYSVCIKPNFVGTAQAFLDDSDVKVCTVISFPKGDDSSMKKVKETDAAITDGADEIDMVMNYKLLQELTYTEGEEYDDIYEELVQDVRNVVKICHKDGIIVKVIIEIEELNYNQIKLACNICVDAGADFVKTSTGFAPTMKPFEDKLEKIKYMRKILPEYIKIKISGGIRNREQIEQVLPFVDRIGTSIIIE